MRIVIDAIGAEYRRYKALAERSVDQLSGEEIRVRSGDGNSVATLLQHLGGNLRSRFTDFLTGDGEKSWRDREAEFVDASMSRESLMAQWEDGWRALTTALDQLSDEMIEQPVTIRGVPLSVIEALTRSLAHTSYHVGQIVLIARGIRGADWQFLSIAPGGSAAYNQNPTLEKLPK